MRAATFVLIVARDADRYRRGGPPGGGGFDPRPPCQFCACLRSLENEEGTLLQPAVDETSMINGHPRSPSRDRENHSARVGGLTRMWAGTRYGSMIGIGTSALSLALA